MSAYHCKVHNVWTIVCGHPKCQLLARIEAADDLIRSIEAGKKALLKQIERLDAPPPISEGKP